MHRCTSMLWFNILLCNTISERVFLLYCLLYFSALHLKMYSFNSTEWYSLESAWISGNDTSHSKSCKYITIKIVTWNIDNIVRKRTGTHWYMFVLAKPYNGDCFLKFISQSSENLTYKIWFNIFPPHQKEDTIE